MATPVSSAKEKPTASPKKSSGKAIVIEWFLLTLIAAGAGIAIALFNPAASLPDAASKSQGAGATASIACSEQTTNLLDLPPVVTNIGAPADTWVRLEASIVFDGKTTPHPEVIAAEIATDELAYLRTVTITQMQGPIGLENMRQDLTDRAVVRSGGKVNELILRTLVVQ
jgi:flagellar FliL protein